jgi:hypothetical protein
VTTPAAPVSFVASFNTEYLLTMAAGAGGTVSPPGGYYNAGATVQIAATANSGWGFSAWAGSGTGSYSGTDNPATVTMNGPVTEAANFSQFTQQGGKLVGSGASGAAYQGTAAALSADGNTAIVGGPSDNGGVGAAWIFTRSNGVWGQQGAKLVGTSPTTNPGLLTWNARGSSVAISADGNTALAGGAAAAWVFVRNNGVWSQQGSALVGSGATFAGFSPLAVAISGDGNTAILGGWQDSNLATGAYVFTRANGVWTQQGAKLFGSGADTFSDFGESVAISSDGNTAIVGGSGDGLYTGAVWVFTRAGGVWSQQGGKLAGTGTGSFASQQGKSVALSADGNTFITGGRNNSSGVARTWVFTRANGAWSQQGNPLTAGGGSVNVHDMKVAIAGDGNTALVGSPGDAAAVWVFTRTNGAWSVQGSLAGSGAAGDARQGDAVALSADGRTAMLGGPRDNANAGAAWVFAAPQPPSPVPAPTGAVPASGSGTTGTFTFTFSDTAGWQSLNVVDVLIRDALDGRQACYVAFVPSGANAGSVFLVDDGGNAGGPYAGMVLPGSGSVANSQCSITGAGSSVTASGNSMALTLAVTFTPAFGGNKVFYLAAQDASSNSGWQAMGTWNTGAAAVSGPGVVGVTPGRGTGLAQNLTFTFGDTNGWQDIAVANVLINNAINGISACYLAFVPAGAGSGALYLVDNAGNAGGPFAGMTLPGSGSISNGQCTISGAGSSVSGTGNILTLNLAVTFSSGFAGNKVVYLAARNGTQNSGWQAVGSAAIQ